ncbi:MAG: hypothetical protein K9L68_07265 [Spirochaetales bacterium]|nr:hypothetical protein [Spirochaetales bacterium]MCF7938383.1 hypothetical protein [Spirochaetales bacterium]
MTKKCKFIISISFLILFFTSTVHAVNEQTISDLESIRDQAVQWLLEQKTPNRIVEAPLPWRRNLVISYRIPESDPAARYLTGRAYIYDSALAAIAFTMTERYQEAEDVLFALSRQLRPDGSLWFGVNLDNDWPSEEGHQGATVRSGASAWAGYAAVYYIKKRKAEDPDFTTGDRISRRILFFAEKTARHLLSLQITDPDDPRYGLVTGGMGTYTLRVNEEGEVVSDYADTQIGWASTEHNIDVYFLFRDLAEITGGGRYRNGAQMVAEGLLSLWNKEHNQLIQGIKKDGRRDTVLPLDTSSWGSMFLRSAGYTEKAEAALEAGIDRFRVGKSGRYRPYADDPVYPDKAVSRAYLDNPGAAWNGIDINWPEGALGMAAALVKSEDADRIDHAIEIIQAAAELSEEGGIPYASREIPHQFSTYPSVASTAWLVIAVENLLDAEDKGLFWE